MFNRNTFPTLALLTSVATAALAPADAAARGFGGAGFGGGGSHSFGGGGGHVGGGFAGRSFGGGQAFVPHAVASETYGGGRNWHNSGGATHVAHNFRAPSHNWPSVPISTSTPVSVTTPSTPVHFVPPRIPTQDVCATNPALCNFGTPPTVPKIPITDVCATNPALCNFGTPPSVPKVPIPGSICGRQPWLSFCNPGTPPNPNPVPVPPPVGNPGGYPPILGWKHHPHWWVDGFPVVIDGPASPVVADAVPVAQVPAAVQPAPCTCLTKQYLDDGSVLFSDICTKEQALATVDELKAQAQALAPLRTQAN
jgi:hypothetical protein